MKIHQLTVSFDVFLLDPFRIPEELLRHGFHADQLPPAVVFSNILPQVIIGRGNRIDRSAVRTAEEGVLDLTIRCCLRHERLRHSAAIIAFDFHENSFHRQSSKNLQTI